MKSLRPGQSSQALGAEVSLNWNESEVKREEEDTGYIDNILENLR